MLTAEADPHTLFRRHYTLASRFAYRWQTGAVLFRIDLADLYQTARLGLWRACVAFDAARGDFRPYAIQGVRDHVLALLRRSKRRLNVMATPDTFMRAVEGSPQPDAALCWDVHDLLATLTARERYVVRHRFGLGRLRPKLVGEIARRMGRGRSRVSQLLGDALRKLQAVAVERGLLPDDGRLGDVGACSGTAFIQRPAASRRATDGELRRKRAKRRACRGQ